MDRAQLVIGIDASRNRSGGAKSHISGILNARLHCKFGIKQIHIWSYKKLLDDLPNEPWLIKHDPPALEQNTLKQLIWQRFNFSAEVEKSGCDIVLNTDAGTVSRFKPAVTMSRDMLSFEPGEMQRFALSKSWLRLLLLRYVQSRSLKSSEGAIFLTKHAADTIQKYSGPISNITYIPHGVSMDFKTFRCDYERSAAGKKSLRCLYVSNIALYKHQWHVVKAVGILRKKGYDISLILAGGGPGSGKDKAHKLLKKAMSQYDPDGSYVEQLGYVQHKKLPRLLASADVFVFASSCENMPNTLVEAMAIGLPIACSDRGPMPEVLGDGGLYFNPEDPETIADALEKIVKDDKLRRTIAKKAKDLSGQYSWERCASETWSFLKSIPMA